MKNSLEKELSEKISDQMELIFKLVESEEHDGRCILLFALINKALSEILQRPITQDDFFDEEQHMAALKLLEVWLDRENCRPRTIH